MMIKYNLIVSEESKTILLGAKLAKICWPGCIIDLNGCIGTGKSVLCKGFLRALGYIDDIRSPTYSIVRSYYILQLNQHVHHFDFYRLNTKEEFINIGIQDYFDGKSICLIEWPKKEIRVLPRSDISITIYYDNNNEKYRKIVINLCSSKISQSVIHYFDVF